MPPNANAIFHTISHHKIVSIPSSDDHYSEMNPPAPLTYAPAQEVPPALLLPPPSLLELPLPPVPEQVPAAAPVETGPMTLEALLAPPFVSLRIFGPNIYRI
jgi:hypothetical protein